ncbi:trichothecene C-15 hydroxylase [Cryphonectria parasitica EP155]|uniref:Trichothecene C-15 hydroxylase n=1 Tax=Cryphonectria parasitica (strain ATCC 38755 / EP155) TaxID=660469 RepID=A0A9P4Y0E9_CRYP1|nr:trichothecene C-15 hydroxylase [Cryphonectria parasitica EP155]KAF3764261.1 trichothecene C-15 hydroxylase [Cryphonectria parasitica EP155]
MAPTLDTSRLLGLQPSVALLCATLFLVVGYAGYSVIYNLFLSPLSSVAGPKLWAISGLPYAGLYTSGQGHKRMQKLHEKYGDVVRVAPNHIAFLDPRIWKEALGHRKAGALENLKDPSFFSLSGNSIIGPVNTQEHGRQRRILSHAFSAQSMAEQQPLIRGYVDLLMQRLKENCEGGARALDMTTFYNFATFDIIGDLAFGEPFGCLNDNTYHPWVALIIAGIKQAVYLLQVRRNFPAVERFIRKHLMPYFMAKRLAHDELTRAKVAKRMAMQGERPDFMQAMLAKDAEGEDKLTLDQIRLNASLLIIAGSETTATALSGATYFLGSHPDVLARLATEVRSSFSSEDEITLLSVQKLKYMLAVLDETLRLFPPVPTSFPRRAHEGGDVFCGTYLPENTVIDIWQFAMSRSPKNFTLPDSFIPERWLGDARFANDKREASQPFSHGPRNCVGKNLAYAEMRLIMARIIWNFDIVLAEPNVDWIDINETYSLWEKKPLYVHLKPRPA